MSEQPMSAFEAGSPTARSLARALKERDVAKAELAHARDVVRLFLQDLQDRGTDLLLIRRGEDWYAPGVDEELLIQLRDLVRRP